MVMRSGEDQQLTAQARIVRVIPESDLALLELVDRQTGLVSLALDDDTRVVEQMEVIALGFPYGDALAVRGKQFPSVSVNVASIAATRTRAAHPRNCPSSR